MVKELSSASGVSAPRTTCMRISTSRWFDRPVMRVSGVTEICSPPPGCAIPVRQDKMSSNASIKGYFRLDIDMIFENAKIKFFR